MPRVRHRKKKRIPAEYEESLREIFLDEMIESGIITWEERDTCVPGILEYTADSIVSSMLTHLEDCEVRLDSAFYSKKAKKDVAREPLTAANLKVFCERMRSGIDTYYRKYGKIQNTQGYMFICIREKYPEINSKKNGRVRDMALRCFGRNIKQDLKEMVSERLDDITILKSLSKNPRYADIANPRLEELVVDAELMSFITEGMPSDYSRLYPRARLMKREFILHTGPTNSGKTHDAIEDLLSAKSGVYLAPLRLMAYEQYETMQEAGLNARMLTGEESYGDTDAPHVSSTVEMADYSVKYEVAVIDEAQMLADPDRGYAWTAAILGIRASRIHVCAAPHAEEIVKKLADICGDEIRVVRHERLVPIMAQEREVRFPDDVQAGDALIVFSRKSVHAAAGVLRENGIGCSIIYGALPYDVRHEEVRKFRDRETDVVVATDAIGMGMNLPVKRVVFIEDVKFDGRNRRELLPAEVQQIAGRAGRYGIYDMGVYGSIKNPLDIKYLYESETEPITQAVVNIPKDILLFDTKLSSILEKWSEVPVKEGFIKANVRREIELAKRLEQLSDDKQLIYEFVNLKFDEESYQLIQLWEECFMRVMLGEGLALLADEGIMRKDMAGLEMLYREYDLLYSCITRFEPGSELIYDIEQKRRDITERLITLLQEQKFESRRCRRCGKALPFGYRYGICERCYSVYR